MGKKIIKTIYMGTPKLSATILEALLNADFSDYKLNFVGAITEPDKPVGREQILTPPAVKVLALEKKLPVFQPQNKQERIETVQKLAPDLIIVAAYGRILSKEVLDASKLGAINVHGSLLPELRGASPIQYAILEGKLETGVTIMLMDEKMDEGPMLLKGKLKIEKDETSGSLFPKMAELGAKTLIKALPKYLSGEIKPEAQDHTKATYTKMIEKEDGHIQWSKSAEEIERMIRAFDPWPGTYGKIKSQNSKVKDKSLKIIKASMGPTQTEFAPGTIFKEGDKLLVACGNDSSLIIEKLQLEGKKPTMTAEFLNGHAEIINAVLE